MNTLRTAAPTLDEELLRLISKYGSQVPLPVFLVAALISYLAAKSVPLWICLSWLASVTLILSIRYYVLKRLPSWHYIPTAVKMRVALLLSLINGSCHSLSFLFFPYLPAVEQALLTLVIASLCTGAIATTGGHRGIFIAYMTPTMGGLVLSWGILAFYPAFDATSLYVFILLLFFSYIQYSLSKDAFRLFKESFDIRSQQNALNQKLEQALSDAESANAAKTRFLASASHDLRQPIHTLSLLSTSLSMRPLDERSKEISQHIGTAIDALATQLDALLDISKLDACIIDVNKGNFDLSELCRRLSDEFKATAFEKGLNLRCQTPERALTFNDPILLERVIRNLVSNAIKYTEHGSITIELQSNTPDRYQLVIKDTGVGIAEHEHKLVFEEFYQSHNRERDRSQGLGLGLSIVKRLVALMNISLELSSAPGKGTEITLHIPLAEDEDAQHQFDAPIKTKWHGLKVLVVDDEAMIRFGMEAMLSELGAEVLLAESTEAALEQCQHCKPDLVLADFRLRGDDSGLHAIRSIQQAHGSIPSLLISGDTAPNRLQEAREEGIRLLHKPVSLDMLSEAVNAIQALTPTHHPSHERVEEKLSYEQHGEQT